MRALLTYTYPFGAEETDTGEYMLGDVAVNVVLMESDPTMWPYDNNLLNHPTQPGRSAPAEDWTGTGSAVNSISGVKDRVESGLEWWKETLIGMFPNLSQLPNGGADLLNFHINWEHADNPVHTGFEPISRISDDVTGHALSTNSSVTSVVDAARFSGQAGLSSIDDFYNGADIYFTSGSLKGQHGRVIDYVGATRTLVFGANTFTGAPFAGPVTPQTPADTFRIGNGWMYDFLEEVGFNGTGNFESDILAYNDHTRQEAGADWAFTIFVVNDLNDTDDQFAANGAVRKAFSYAGGKFMVVPADRPPPTYAHETGHQFWAIDQYAGGGNYDESRGYYNTPNSNAADNPDFGTNDVQSIGIYQGKRANISGATLASPIVITSNNHGLATGMEIQVSGVGGNSAANGFWTITVLNENQFSLNDSQGNNNYTGGGTWVTTETVTGGSFRLTINPAGGQSFTTGQVAHNASASVIQTAINVAASGVVPGWSNGDIAVLGGPLTSAPLTLTYRGASVDFQEQGLVTFDATNLTGIGGPGSILQLRAGSPRISQQQPSIMAGDVFYTPAPPDPTPPPNLILTTAYNTHTSSPSSLAQIGWQDTDTAFGGVANNGIFDVLDVPFSLSGFGQYNPATGLYEFHGHTNVNTLPNLNPEGNGNDITINRIRVVEVSFDAGQNWNDLITYDDPQERVYSKDFSVDIAVPSGVSEIRIRSRDRRTGVTS